MRTGFIAAMLLLPGALAAQRDTTVTVSFGGFVDTYYAYFFDLQDPGDAPLLTQPVRNNEFNINLAYLETRVTGNRVRGRLALQLGTSVQANYALEPTFGNNSGSLLARHIQEAVAGYRVADNVWIDAGIFLSHIGAEGWISRDNWTYTRSMIAEYSPYYESGVKATWSPNGKFTATLALLNGWQNIAENNGNKAAGVRLDWTPSSRVTLSYSNFLGDEAPAGSESRTRFFNDFVAKVMVTDRFGLLGSFDIGTQSDTLPGDDDASWWGYAAIARFQASPTVAIAGRFEQYPDRDGIFLVGANGPGLEVTGFSANVDVMPAPRFLWRTEFRVLKGDEDVFIGNRGTLTNSAPFLVSSFALTF